MTKPKLGDPGAEALEKSGLHLWSSPAARNLKKVGEIVVAIHASWQLILAVYSGTIAALATMAHLSGLISINLAVYILLGCTLAAVTSALLTRRSLGRLHTLHDSANREATVSLSRLSEEREDLLRRGELLAEASSRSERELSERISALNIDATKLRKVLTITADLSRFHAKNDRTLFEALNGFLLGDSWDKVETIAFSTIDIDIRLTLDALCTMLKVATDDCCAACVKTIVWVSPNGKLEEAKLITRYRDKDSDDARERPDEENTVMENTITEEIILKRQPFWGDDNLKLLSSKGLYRNSRKDLEWQQFYNATLGTRISAFRDKKLKVRDCGALCVDNMSGGLDNEVCRELLRNISWRVGVMLYRLRTLEKGDLFTMRNEMIRIQQ